MTDNQQQEMVPVPDPYHLIISQSLYKAIKFNQAHQNKTVKEIHKEDAAEFKKFKILFKDFINRLNAQDPTAFSVLSTVMGMWGYSRKFCGMCGRPIIGKAGYIQNRMVCGTCSDSYKIAESIHKHQDDIKISDEVKSSQKEE